MNYPSCFYGGEHCVDLPFWLIIKVSGLLITFVFWKLLRYKHGKTKNVISAGTRKEIFKIVMILIVIAVLIPWVIQTFI